MCRRPGADAGVCPAAPTPQSIFTASHGVSLQIPLATQATGQAGLGKSVMVAVTATEREKQQRQQTEKKGAGHLKPV